jgi:hypothetical protein
MLNQHGLTLSEHLPKLPAKEPQAETFNSKKISARDIIKGEGLLDRAYTTNILYHTRIQWRHKMAMDLPRR